MSFYKLGQSFSFQWALRPDTSPPGKVDFDIKIEKPDTVITYLDDELTAYTAPTATEQGLATYVYTPQTSGRHVVTLNIGTDASHVIQARREIYVVDPPDYVEDGATAKIVRGPAVIPPPEFPRAACNPTGHSYSTNSQGENQGQTVAWMDSGAKVSFAGLNQDTIFVLDLSSALNLSTATYNSDNRALAGIEGTIRHMEWKPDGLQFWTAPTNSSGFAWIKEWNVASTAWVAAASTHDETTNGIVSSNTNFRWRKTDGAKLYVLDQVADVIHQFSAGTPWDITGTLTDDVVPFTPSGTAPTDFAFSPDGRYVYVLFTGGTIEVYTMSTAWDLDTVSASPIQTFDISVTAASPIAFDLYGPTDLATNVIVLDTTGTGTLYTFNLVY